jgi:hypothetical protein
MATPHRTPYEADAPLAKGQGIDDDFDMPTDDTSVSLPPPPSDPILPPPSNAI